MHFPSFFRKYVSKPGESKFSNDDLTQRTEGSEETDATLSPPQGSPAAAGPVPMASVGDRVASAHPVAPAQLHRQPSSWRDDDVELNQREVVREHPDKAFGATTARRRMLEEARQLGLPDDSGLFSRGAEATQSAEGVRREHRSKNVMLQVAEQ